MGFWESVKDAVETVVAAATGPIAVIAKVVDDAYIDQKEVPITAPGMTEDQLAEKCMQDRAFEKDSNFMQGPNKDNEQDQRDFCKIWSRGIVTATREVAEAEANKPSLGVGIIESLVGWPLIKESVKAAVSYFFPGVADCFSDVYSYLVNDGPEPATSCWIIVATIAVVGTLLVVGGLILLATFVPLIGPSLGILRDLGEWVGSAFRTVVVFAFRMAILVLSWLGKFADWLAYLTESHPYSWKILFGLCAVWAALQLLLKGRGLFTVWENSYFEDIYKFLDYPIIYAEAWVANKLNSKLVDWLLSAFLSPFEMGILVISVFIGLVYLPIYEIIKTVRQKKSLTPTPEYSQTN